MQQEFKILGRDALAYEFQIGGMPMVATNLDTPTEILVNGKMGNILPYCTLAQFTFRLSELADREPELRIEVTPTANFTDEIIIEKTSLVSKEVRYLEY
ncbi:MAG: hypothetical protein QW683_08625 [Candidatus Caldarchaeum sp.]